MNYCPTSYHSSCRFFKNIQVTQCMTSYLYEYCFAFRYSVGRVREREESADQDGLDQEEGVPGCHDVGDRHGRLQRRVWAREPSDTSAAPKHEGVHRTLPDHHHHTQGTLIRHTQWLTLSGHHEDSSPYFLTSLCRRKFLSLFICV